jgi:outer membrane protein OmpA-like peptidoglycan-associated protein
MRLAFFAAILAVLSQAAIASDRAAPDNELWFFGGVQGGLSDLSGTSGGELDKSGWNLGLKLLASKYTREWVFDAGLGWFHDQQSASGANSSIKVLTNAGFADLGARYRLSPNWQLGPVAQILFGPDVNFSESTAAGTATPMALLGGARVEYEILNTSNTVRIGGQIVTDLTISSRQVSWFQIDLQFGLTPKHEAAEPAPAPTPEPEPVVDLPIPPMVEPDRPFPAVVTEQKEVAITLNDVLFHFDTSSAKLHPDSIKRLKKLAYFLLKNNDAWKSIRIDGHTDRRGAAAYNTKLSKRRAQAVAKTLEVNGLPREKMKVTGFGPTRPVDPAMNHVAYAKNRRVEVVLHGVSDPARLANDINRLSDK